MKDSRWKIYLGTSLLALAALLYGAHYLYFRDSHHLFIFLLGDIAFVPLEVFLVTLVFHALLQHREKRRLNHSLSMTIGMFFHEVGAELLLKMQRNIPQKDCIRRYLSPEEMEKWTETDYTERINDIQKRKAKFKLEAADLVPVRDFLLEKRDFILRMLENQNLKESSRFVTMIWAITHVSDELVIRPSLEKIKPEDIEHLETDLQRAFDLLVLNWMRYVLYLKKSYPFMYVAALRYGPFAEAVVPEEVTEWSDPRPDDLLRPTVEMAHMG